MHFAGKYSERAFQALDYILDEASEVGVRLILTMADNWSPADSKQQVHFPFSLSMPSAASIPSIHFHSFSAGKHCDPILPILAGILC